MVNQEIAEVGTCILITAFQYAGRIYKFFYRYHNDMNNQLYVRVLCVLASDWLVNTPPTSTRAWSPRERLLVRECKTPFGFTYRTPSPVLLFCGFGVAWLYFLSTSHLEQGSRTVYRVEMPSIVYLYIIEASLTVSCICYSVHFLQKPFWVYDPSAFAST